MTMMPNHSLEPTRLALSVLRLSVRVYLATIPAWLSLSLKATSAMSIPHPQKPTELRLVVVSGEWATLFAEERSPIAEALASSALDTQHIGSTAIPGITA